MSKISNILSELGVSKVRLAKYLGVSRQMLYNYLACENLEDWPSEKATRLMQLLEIKNEKELKQPTALIKHEKKINKHYRILEGEEKQRETENMKRQITSTEIETVI